MTRGVVIIVAIILVAVIVGPGGTKHAHKRVTAIASPHSSSDRGVIPSQPPFRLRVLVLPPPKLVISRF